MSHLAAVAFPARTGVPSLLSRSSKLLHTASGFSLETPILIPSFSSKAFGFGHDGNPEVQGVLEAAQEFITKTCLISAYDVHYKYVPEPLNLPVNVDLMFLDSGGYEVSDDWDLAAVENQFIDQRSGMLPGCMISGASGRQTFRHFLLVTITRTTGVQWRSSYGLPNKQR